jgi:acyl-CoA thioesterase I
MAHRRSFRIHPQHEAFADAIIHAQTSGMLARYAESIRRIAIAHTVILADVHREWQRMVADGLDTDVWLINGLNHPDRRGHKLAAQVIFARLLALSAEIESAASPHPLQ